MVHSLLHTGGEAKRVGWLSPNRYGPAGTVSAGKTA
jgi:hypothetical protein